MELLPPKQHAAYNRTSENGELSGLVRRRNRISVSSYAQDLVRFREGFSSLLVSRRTCDWALRRTLTSVYACLGLSELCVIDFAGAAMRTSCIVRPHDQQQPHLSSEITEMSIV